MTRFDRAEIAEFVDRWIEANAECERNKDWKPLAAFYADDATYGWNYGTKDDFMAVGIDEIREAPGDSQLHGDTTIAIQADRTYILRSRRTSASYTGCENYAKVQPLSVDATAGTVKLRVIGNARCNDRRLVEVD